MNPNNITRQQAKLLKPYLIYMDYYEVKKDRELLVRKLMYQNMAMGNVSQSFITELQKNYALKNPGCEIPDVLRIAD